MQVDDAMALANASQSRREGRRFSQQHDNHDGWMLESMVKAAQTCNKLFTVNTCRMCHVYADKQVEYEQRQEFFGRGASSPVERVWMRTALAAEPSQLEVELYRQFLFDEDSVVETVSSREYNDETDASESFAPRGRQGGYSCSELVDEDEEHTITTQRTS